MLSSKNLVLDSILCQTMFGSSQDDTCFSVLPLHHAYECTATFLDCVYSGVSMAFCRGLKYIRKDILEAKPTIMIGVPAIFENFYNKILRSIRDQVSDKTLLRIYLDKSVENHKRIRLPKKICKQILSTFGGELRIIISGGAAIDKHVLDFFNDIGIDAIQGYGLSECSPIVALNPAKRKYMRNASAGYLLPFMECKIEDRDENGIGEICFRGPTIMLGYYNDPERTAEVIDTEGWFHTGDLGYLDSDGYVYITGRKKNVIVTSNGKNVFPEELESYLLESKYISECMVWGADTDPGTDWNGICATLRLDEDEVAAALGTSAKVAVTPLPGVELVGASSGVSNKSYDDAVRKLIEAEVDRINAKSPRFKKIAHIIIRNREFDKTTSQKIRRFVEDNKRA